jgi:hypothetical protein
MTIRPLTWLEIGAAVLLVIVGAVGLHEHDAKIREQAVAQAVQDTQKQLQQQYSQQVSDLQKQMADRDSQYQQQLKALDTRFQSANTPAQTASLIASLMGLKQPIVLSTPAATPANPNPATVAQVSSIDFPQAKAYIQACEDCKLQNAKLTADAATREQEAVLAQKQIDSLKTENTALQVAVKGGSVWHRTWKAMEYIVIGGAIGYIAAKH